MLITYKDRITNETIRQMTQQVPLPVSNRMRLKWLGHVLRMNDDRLTNSVHQWNATGKRSRRRPNKRWIDCIEEDLRRAGVNKVWREKQQEDNE